MSILGSSEDGGLGEGLSSGTGDLVTSLTLLRSRSSRLGVDLGHDHVDHEFRVYLGQASFEKLVSLVGLFDNTPIHIIDNHNPVGADIYDLTSIGLEHPKAALGLASEIGLQSIPDARPFVEGR